MKNINNKDINYITYEKRFISFLSKHKTIILPFAFFLLYVLLYFLVDTSSQSLVAHDEGLYARRSRLVEDSNNWFSYPFSSPHHKTIGSYWLIALSMRFFGNSEMALRLPSILISFLCLFITYLIAIRLSNKISALISVFSLSSMPLWVQYSRYASPDVPFVLCILLVILFFLKFIDSSQTKNKYFYIFTSGIFLSTAFFVRSYMVFVPFFGLSPFITYHLLRNKNIFKITFFAGIVIGFLPTLINLYFSYKQFGIIGITSLFSFAKKQAIGEFDISNILFIPLNYLYLTFPVGILLILLIVFTKVEKNIKYPLLSYFYPVISCAILLCMSTSYPHYYLFLMPFMSIIFSFRLHSFSFRFTLSKKIITLILSIVVFFISFALIFILLNYKYYLIGYSFRQNLLLYIVASFLSISLLSSIRFVIDYKNDQLSLLKFFYNIIIPQYISLSLLYNFGIIGNPNFKTKSFLKDQSIASIANANTIYLYNADSKIQTLLSYYLPSSVVIESLNNLDRVDYLITSDKKILDHYSLQSMFKKIKGFDNHYLLMNINK